MDSDYLFVYGTLLKDLDNEMSNFLASHSVFTGKGYFYGELYKVSWYPGAILSNDVSDKVYGMIFKVKNSEVVFKVLDEYEGLGDHQSKPYLFKRELITVFIETNIKIKSWVYLYDRPIKNLKKIISGDFINP
jgi:gamma-glutamylcyclotransferase (GGCT)/AIG2-like uncharacterized protein YtfP